MLGAFAAIAAVAAIGLSRLREQEDPLAFLPTGDRDVRLFSDVARRFGGLRVAMVGAEAPAGHDVFEPETLRRLREATDQARQIEGVDRVMSMTSLADVASGPAGAEVTALVDRVPSNAEEHRALRERVLGREHIAGTLVSRDGRAALIMVFIVQGASDRAVTDAVREMARRTLAPLEVYFGGAPFAARTIYDEARADVRRLSPIALLVLLVVVVLSFRDWVGVLLTVGTVGFSVLVVLGAMGLWGLPFDVASATLPVILFASGSSYAVHVLGRYYLLRRELESAAAIAGALGIVRPPLLVAAATTSVGFFAFAATDVLPMRVFGVACGAGVLVCWLSSLTLVPAALTLWPRPPVTQVHLARLGAAMVALWDGAHRRRVVIVASAAVGAVLLAPPALRVRVRMEPRAFFRPGSEPWRADRFLEDRFGGGRFVHVAVAADLDDPRSLRELARLEEHARALPGVTGVSSILGPLRQISEMMGSGRRLPWSRAEAAGLYFFVENEAGVSSLMSPERDEALLHVRVRGDASAVAEALERFVAERLRVRPSLPSSHDVVERAASAIGLVTGRPRPRLDSLSALIQGARLPADDDPAWGARRTAAARAFLASDEAPELGDGERERVVQRLAAGDAAEAALRGIVGGEGEARGLRIRLEDERRAYAVANLVDRALEALALTADPAAPQLRRSLAPILDDCFPPDGASAQPDRPLAARVAGEPILDRGFSRAVERNQLRGLVISLAVVLLVLGALFRSARTAAVCLAPAVLTMLIVSGGLGLLGVHIDLGTSLVAGIATGAGSDFAMHYLWYLRDQPEREVSRTVGPIQAVSILLVSLGFVVLALGESPVMRLFGVLTAIVMTLSALLTCVLLPALLARRDARRA